MPLPSSDALVAAGRMALAVAGTFAALVLGSWPAATACFAALAAGALLSARVAERRDRRSRSATAHDPLTTAGAYRSAHARLAETAASDPARLAGLTLDADRFAEINDRYGHLGGDRLLQEVGRALLEDAAALDGQGCPGAPARIDGQVPGEDPRVAVQPEGIGASPR
jgi:predicted signal transduction protein with EAL and GGDEF domain